MEILDTHRSMPAITENADFLSPKVGVQDLHNSGCPGPSESLRPGLSSHESESMTWMEYELRTRGQAKFSTEFERSRKGSAITRIHIIRNWFEEPKRLVPAGRQ
jgi:hypothetical protein